MLSLNSPELKLITKLLGKYDLRSTVTQLSALLTVPVLQANTIRIEILIHLAVSHCHGHRRPNLTKIGHWLNQHLGNTQLASLEDPAENIFITNIETPEGNRRVFEGIWESNDYFLQVVIETLNKHRVPQKCRDLLIPAFALLKLSDCVAERVGLQRWHIEPSVPNNTIRLAPTTRGLGITRATTFTDKELDALGISREVLAPFIFQDKDKQALVGESIGHSSLERHPLIEFKDELILSLPHAVSPAIRRFVLSELEQMRHIQRFANALSTQQARQIEMDVFREFKRDAISFTPPTPDGNIPPLSSWLLKFDINKYLHIVLLHDRMDLLNTQGLSSFMEYPEELEAGLGEYLSKVSSECRSLPGFTTGITLLVMGGLGRGYAFRFKNLPNPDQWHLSIIQISDLLMLAGELDRPITHYLKCMKQKKWAERQGVYFHSINGDYNVYCFWRRMNYQLVPRDLPVDDGSMISIANDMALPVREKVKNLLDHHVIETIDGHYSPVIRFGCDAYFKSMQNRPVYVSLEHLHKGMLAGVVETPRGPSWLLIEPREGNEQMRHLLYEMWSGFIGLYDRLVFEIEALHPKTLTGAIEICLDFGEVVVFEDYREPQSGVLIDKPKVTVNLDKRTALVKFPSDFLIHFQQPENIGEKLVLHSIAKGLVSLYQGSTGTIDEAFLYDLTNRVIGTSGMRILHLFSTRYPIEHLLARQGQKTIFLAQEDFVFSKLRLSENCTSVKTGNSITSKSESNDFLHRVVDKIWNQLRKLLKQLDRTSVIREVLTVHEAAIQDRDHWNRTAKAVIALYESEEDVFTVAQERESDRKNVSLSARTILEMAICECPENGGHQLSRWELDELLAKAALLIEVATDSDAINSDLIEPQINLHLNGEYSIDRGFYNTVIKPFLSGYFHEEFEAAAENYSKLYQKENTDKRTRADEVFSADFIRAFLTEFGLTPDEAVDGFAELMDLAVECNNVVVETTLGDLKARLIKTRGLSPEASEAFVRTFSIFHRPEWDKPPPGFRNRDINPWRFRRRLSSTARPIFVFGEENNDKVLYGAGIFRLGFGYLFERSERGHLPQEFFTTTKMKQYIGAVNNERGHAFARSVADQLRENGWEVRNEVQMTELGGSPEYGDIDVLAWKPSGEIQLIECKRLQLARTVAEVAEICRRFRGEARDELDRHVGRINWLRTNPSGLQHIVGFDPVPDLIDDRLVTNTHVPMMYLTTLPIEANKIGPLR